MPVTGAKGGKHMKKKIKYTDEPMNFKIIDDFLPSPEKLAEKDQNVKVTLTLSKDSVDFFKEWANKQHGHYQTMIRKVLDHYVAHYQH